MQNAEGVACRLAHPTDAKRIVEIIREGFAADFISMTPLGCCGAVAYCQALIREREHGGTSVFMVAELAGEIVGCLELRTAIESIHINYVSVIPGARSRGVASCLLDYSVEWARQPFHHWLRLDVLVENAIAQEWYLRRGFKRSSTTNWYILKPEESSTVHGYITSSGQSEHLQAVFGFSEVRVLTPKGQYRVGLLGESWVRVTDLAVLADDDALGLVSNRFPERSILVMTGVDLLPPAAGDVRLVAQTVRMEMPLLDYLRSVPA